MLMSPATSFDSKFENKQRRMQEKITHYKDEVEFRPLLFSARVHLISKPIVL